MFQMQLQMERTKSSGEKWENKIKRINIEQGKRPLGKSSPRMTTSSLLNLDYKQVPHKIYGRF